MTEIQRFCLTRLDAIERRPRAWGSHPELVGRYETLLTIIALPDENVVHATFNKLGKGPIPMQYLELPDADLLSRLQFARQAVLKKLKLEMP